MKSLISDLKWIGILGSILVAATYPMIVGGLAVIALLIFAIYKANSTPEKFINSSGYVVLSHNNELEHRHIASQILNRSLRPNEVVHHINGRKAENQISNLCLMDSEKHEFFHSWLRWKKEKTGRYPSMSSQKRVLKTEYNGILLENYRQPVKIRSTELSEASALDKKLKLQKILYNELRRERKRLAMEQNVPLYIIFDNKTLTEMAVAMPVSESAMLDIRGVGPVKYKMYGASFISVVKQFKTS